MKKAILILFALALILPSAALAEKLGDISSYTGEVLIRNKGEWNKITKVPQPIFSSDKVVGRAEIRFVDGGLIRMHIDSILSIVREKESMGMAKKEQVTSRTVKLLVGDIWFNVRVKKGHSFKFKTPSMTADITGTSGPVKHTLDGQSSIGFRTGSGDVTGIYDEIPLGEMRPYASRLVYQPIESVPLSDQKFRESKQMRAAEKAYNEQFKAQLAASKAAKDSAAAKAAGNQAAKSTLDSVKVNAARASSKASASKSRAQHLASKAQVAAAEDTLLEAEIFGDSDAIEMADRSLSKSRQKLREIENLLNEVQNLEKAANRADSVLDAKAIATKAQAKAAVTQSNAAIIKVATQLAIAEGSGDEGAAGTAMKQLQATEETTQITDLQSRKDSWLVDQMRGEPDEQVTYLLIAAKALAASASINAETAEAQAAISAEATAGDTDSLAAAEARATEMEQLTITVNIAASDIEEALAEGNANALLDASSAIYTATRDITGEAEPPELIESPTMEPSDMPRLPVSSLPLSVESEDLPSSYTTPDK
jgi:hypothetical protein